MGIAQFAVITFGALAGGFVSGLAGFGTGITAMGIWLYTISPSVAASLVVICSVISQAQTLPRIWPAIEAKRVLPFIVPGLFGVPLGTAMLSQLDTRILKLGIGTLLLLFPAYMLLRRSKAKSAWGGSIADGAIGFGGGILGGMAGLSGPLPTVWATIRGWGKEESRAIFQAFNFTILIIALLSHAFAGLLTREVGWALLAALPGTVGGAWLGAHTYGRLNDRSFRVIILLLLCASGSVLIWRSL
jgi:uncharacterized protein